MSTKRTGFLAVTTMLFIGLTGCVSTPRMEFDRRTSGPIKKISVVVSRSPKKIEVINYGVLMGGGLVGGLLQSSVNAAHGDDLERAVTETSHSLAQGLLDATAQSLKKDGFEVVLVDSPPTETPLAQIKVQGSPDAILELSFDRIGYFSGQHSLQYGPFLKMSAHLVTGSNRRDLYQKTFTAGEDFIVPHAEKVWYSPKYRYGSFAELTEHAREAIEGLAACEKEVAEKIGDDLKTGIGPPKS